jgi:hypothetical protein
MIIYAVELSTWDGIEYQKLFSSESKAKEHSRKKNRDIGIKNYYKVVKKEVEE